jgi:hypothetical protein
MTTKSEESNKALVLEAFKKRDYAELNASGRPTKFRQRPYRAWPQRSL